MSAIFGCRDWPKLTRWVLLWLLLAPTLFLHSTRARCEEPTALSKEQTQERQRTIDELDKEYSKLQADGKLDEAIATLEKSMNIQLEVYGTDRDDGVNSMEWLAALAALKGDFRRHASGAESASDRAAGARRSTLARRQCEESAGVRRAHDKYQRDGSCTLA